MMSLKKTFVLSAAIAAAITAVVFGILLVWAATSSGNLAPRALLKGDMSTFEPAQSPKSAPPLSFLAGDGSEQTFEERKGKVLLVNFWATWCAPCVEELPSLDRLQARLGGDHFEVVAVSLDRGGAAVAGSFLKEIGVAHLALYADPKTNLSRAFRVSGLPTTILLDRSGKEIGRLAGGATWDGPDALRLIEHAIDVTMPRS